MFSRSLVKILLEGAFVKTAEEIKAMLVKCAVVQSPEGVCKIEDCPIFKKDSDVDGQVTVDCTGETILRWVLAKKRNRRKVDKNLSGIIDS